MVANAELPPDNSGNNNSGGAHVQVKPAEESKVEVGGGYPVCPQVLEPIQIKTYNEFAKPQYIYPVFKSSSDEIQESMEEPGNKFERANLSIF